MNSSTPKKNWMPSAFAVAALCAVLTGCSSSPSSGDGERAIQNRINEQAQGRIKLAKFTKSNGAQGELMGFKIYALEFDAEIEFTEDCKWITGMFGQQLSFSTSKPVAQPKSGFSWNSFLDDTTNPGTLVKRGQRVKLSGVVRFVKKEKGWAVDGVELTKADVGSASQPAQQVAESSADSVSPAAEGDSSPQATACLNNLRELFERAEDLADEQFQKQFEAARKADPTMWDYYFEKNRTKVEWPSLASDFQSMLPVESRLQDKKQALLFTAKVLFGKFYHSAACDEFIKCLSTNPDGSLRAEATLGVAASLAGQGKIYEATQRYQQVVEYFPDSEPATQLARTALAHIEKGKAHDNATLKTFYENTVKNVAAKFQQDVQQIDPTGSLAALVQMKSLSSPAVFFCPGDRKNKPVQDWKNLQTGHISYEIVGRNLTLSPLRGMKDLDYQAVFRRLNGTLPPSWKENEQKEYIKCPVHGFIVSAGGVIRNREGVELEESGNGWESVLAKAAKKERNAVINDLRQIDGAKQQWALEYLKSETDTPSEDDLKPYFRNRRFPLHPPGGNYVLKSVRETPESTSYGSLR